MLGRLSALDRRMGDAMLMGGAGNMGEVRASTAPVRPIRMGAPSLVDEVAPSSRHFPLLDIRGGRPIGSNVPFPDRSERIEDPAPATCGEAGSHALQGACQPWKKSYTARA